MEWTGNGLLRAAPESSVLFVSQEYPQSFQNLRLMVIFEFVRVIMILDPCSL